MSLLKVNNNPRSLLRKADTNEQPKIVTIRSAKNENKKIIIDVVKPPMTFSNKSTPTKVKVSLE